MREVKIVGAARFSPEKFEELSLDDSFRKATFNMKISYLAIKEALAQSPHDLNINRWPSQKVGLFVGTGHGELESTKEFLKGLGLEQKPRPFLFQSGLHNATLGFLSQKLHHTGPGMTLSNGPYSGSDALSVAFEECLSGRLELAIVVGYDSVPQDLSLSMQAIYPPEVTLSSGAYAFILGTMGTVGAPTLCSIKQRCLREENSFVKTNLENYYDANELEQLGEFIKKRQESGKGAGRESVLIERPFDRYTSIEVEF